MGAPVELQQHLRITMAENPLSLARPPFVPIAAYSTHTSLNDVAVNEEKK
jgi:hypothetical protein